MTPEQYIKNKCVEANPSIMELKEYTPVKIGQAKIRLITEINYGNSDIKVDGYSKTWWEPNEYEILGRPITLADVLLTGKLCQGPFDVRGRYFIFPNFTATVGWDLFFPLSGQSDETKMLIAKILGWKAE